MTPPPVKNFFNPATWFTAQDAAVQADETSKAAVNLSQAQDAQVLKQVETKGGVTTEAKPSEALLKLKKEVQKYERAALCARSEAQRKRYYEKAQKLWSEGTNKMTYQEMFGESKRDALEKRFNTDKEVQKIQAGLWLIEDKYGHMLGSFGTMGMDNKQNHFTNSAIEKFRQDYNAGLVYGVKKPGKPLANAKEAKAEILRVAEERMKVKTVEEWKSQSLAYCEQARTNLAFPDKTAADRAFHIYFFRCEDLTKEQASEEAYQLRRMINNPLLDRDVRYRAMHLYHKIAKIHPLPETELEAGLGLVKRMAADEHTNYLLKSTAEETSTTFAEKLSAYKAQAAKAAPAPAA